MEFTKKVKVTEVAGNDLGVPKYEQSAILFSNSSVITNCKISGDFKLTANSSK